MNPGRTIAILAVGGFVISLIVWTMSENKNMLDRGVLLNNISKECASNIQFLQTGQHIAAVKDVTDDVLQEMSTGGRPQLDTRWLMALTSGAVMVSDEKKVAIKKLMTMAEVYNAEMSYQAAEEYYGSGEDDYEAPQRTPAPTKQQLIGEFNSLIRMIEEAKEHRNQLNF